MADPGFNCPENKCQSLGPLFSGILADNTLPKTAFVAGSTIFIVTSGNAPLLPALIKFIKYISNLIGRLGITSSTVF